jgi:hypothetical protein
MSHHGHSEQLKCTCFEWKSPFNKSLRDHSKKISRPSVWMSFSNDTFWILFHAPERGISRNPTCRVAFIVAERLERRKILWSRSEGKTYNAKHLDGVQYAQPRYPLVYGCVPAQLFGCEIHHSSVLRALQGTEYRRYGLDPPTYQLLTWGHSIQPKT